MRYAIVKNGVVENVIIATPEFASLMASFGHTLVPDSLDAKTSAVIKGSYDATTSSFSRLAGKPGVETRYVSVGAFFDRFGADKYEILASEDRKVQALIKDASVRKYIDLDRPDLSAGLQFILNAGYVIDKKLILEAPVQDSERP